MPRLVKVDPKDPRASVNLTDAPAIKPLADREDNTEWAIGHDDSIEPEDLDRN